MTFSAFEDGLIHLLLTNSLLRLGMRWTSFGVKGASLDHSELLRRELLVLEGRVVELQGSLEELDRLALKQATSSVKSDNSNRSLKPYEVATQTRTNTKVLRRKVVASLVKNRRADESDRSLAQRIHDYWAKSPDCLSVSKTPAVSTIQNDITAIKRMEC